MQRLVDRRIPVWIDDPDGLNTGIAADQPRIEPGMLCSGIAPGQQWPTAIDDALMSAFAIVLFWSSAWDAERAVLAREHGVALVRHSTGSARYMPVFLDAESTWPEPVRAYRINSADLVQAYNVAQHGGTHWTKLVDDVEEEYRRRRKAPSARAELHKPARADRAPIDWSVEIATEHGGEEVLRLLLRFPLGPAVQAFRVNATLRNSLGDTTDANRAELFVIEASELVLASLETRPDKPFRFVIAPGDLPNANHVGLRGYCSTVLNLACTLGPRMLAAVLLSAPVTFRHGNRFEIARLLGELENVS